VNILEFVKLEEIDPMFFDKPYFLVPEKGGDKAYSLLRDALKKSGKVGIAKVVLKTREHLAAVKPHGEALVLELMHFSEELADPHALDLPKKVVVGKKELSMAESLIEGMTDEWQPGKYQDEYNAALMEVIQEKIASGGKDLPVRKERAGRPTNMIDLVAVLQQSLSQAKARKPPEKKATAHKKKRAA
jgi:DNA end-binding protein Ku